MLPYFRYLRLGLFTYHVLHDPEEIKSHLMKWSMGEWESDHRQAPEEHWTVEWMETLPQMEFALRIIQLEEVRPRADLMSVRQFQVELQERAAEREESMLRGVSIAPLLVNRRDFELMDGYTRYMVLKKYNQSEVYAYVGHI